VNGISPAPQALIQRFLQLHNGQIDYGLLEKSRSPAAAAANVASSRGGLAAGPKDEHRAATGRAMRDRKAQMSDAYFRDYCMAAFIGAGSGLGALSVLLVGGRVNAFSVVVTAIIASLWTAKYLKAHFPLKS
jgi:hypothetical protein